MNKYLFLEHVLSVNKTKIVNKPAFVHPMVLYRHGNRIDRPGFNIKSICNYCLLAIIAFEWFEVIAFFYTFTSPNQFSLVHLIVHSSLGYF